MRTCYKKILLALILSKLVRQIRNIFSTWCLLTWNSQCSQISENVYHSITLIFTRPNFSSQEMVPPLMTWDVVLTWLLINQKISEKLFPKKTSLIAALKRKTLNLIFTGPNFSPQEMVPPLMAWDVELTWLFINQKISKKLILKKLFSWQP